MKRKTIVKTGIWVVILLIISVVKNALGLIVSNAVSMNQMELSSESYVIPQLYNSFTLYAPWILAIIILLSYSKEIKILIKYIKGKIENEKF